jgi:hypothetical protein
MTTHTILKKRKAPVDSSCNSNPITPKIYLIVNNPAAEASSSQFTDGGVGTAYSPRQRCPNRPVNRNSRLVNAPPSAKIAFIPRISGTRSPSWVGTVGLISSFLVHPYENGNMVRPHTITPMMNATNEKSIAHTPAELRDEGRIK